jgi:hypothetical protein
MASLWRSVKRTSAGISSTFGFAAGFSEGSLSADFSPFSALASGCLLA